MDESALKYAAFLRRPTVNMFLRGAGDDDEEEGSAIAESVGECGGDCGGEVDGDERGDDGPNDRVWWALGSGG